MIVPPQKEGPSAEQERDHLAQQCNELLRENDRLRAALKGAEIALARDSDIDGAMRCILATRTAT